MNRLHNGPKLSCTFLMRDFFFTLIGIFAGLGMLFLANPAVHASSFGNGYQQAQQNGWQTGYWGSAKFYVDNNDNMYVSAGQLQNNFYNTVGNSAANNIRTLNFEDDVQAPRDSSFLFSNANGNQANNTLTAIRGLDKVDMSSVTDAYSIFSQDTALTDMDVSNWNVSNVQDLSYAFDNVDNLEKLDLSRWNTHSATNMSYMFAGATELQNLNVTGVNTTKATVNDIFDNDTHLFWLTLGNSFQIKYESNLTGSPWSSYLGSGNNGLTPMAENMDEDLYEPSSGIWPGSWMGTYNLYGDNGLTKPGNDLSDSTYMGNRTDAAPTYTDNHGNMYIGAGQLQDSISQVTNNDLYVADENSDQAQRGTSNSNINTVSLTAPTATSGLNFYNGSEFNTNMVGLFNNSVNLTHVYGANNFDASSVVTLADYFANDPSLQDLDVSNWDVTKQYDLSNMFSNDASLSSLNLSNWNTAANLNASQNGMFANDTSLSDLSLGNNTELKPESDLPDGTWTNADTGVRLTSAQLTDGNSHPGEWYKPSFQRDFQMAQRRGWQTGYWGTSPWYIDDDGTMHVGNGQLQGPLYGTTGMATAKSIRTLSFDESVQAPADSMNLLSTSYISGDNSSLTDIANLSNVDLSSAQDMKAMFANDTSLPYVDISGMDAGNATDMSYMFTNDSNLNNVNGTNFDTSSVTNFDSMFSNDGNLQNPNIGSWDVHNVKDMNYMFWDDSNLYNLGIVNWGPTNLETMDSTFTNDRSLNTIDLSHWNPTNVQDLHSAFVNDGSLNSLDFSGWHTPNLRDTESTFNGMTHLSHLNLGGWNTSNTNNMHFLLAGDDRLNYLTLGNQTYLKDIDYTPGIEWQDGDQYLNDYQLYNGQSHPGTWQQTQLSYDFQNAQRSGWQTGYWGTAPYYIDNNHAMHVGSGDLQGTLYDTVGNDTARAINHLNFEEPVRAPQDSSNLLSTSSSSGNGSALNGIDGLDHLDMSSAQDMKAMFANDTALGGLTFPHWDTHNVHDMSFMFYDDGALTNLDANNLDTTNVTNMQSMFFNDKALQNAQVNDWNTQQVRGMAYMFSSDNVLSNLDLNSWNTSQVRSMNGMFLNDFQLNDLSISHWDPTDLTDMSGMFINDRNIAYLDLSSWQTPQLQTMESTFNGASGIQHLDIGNLDTEHVNDKHFLFDSDNSIHALDLGPDTHLNGIDYLPGVEWHRGNDFANNAELTDGSSHWGTWQQTQFSYDFQAAQQKHWDTAYWGDAPFYVDDQHNMYVGTGHLSGSLYDALGQDIAHDYVHTVNFVGHAQAPQDSSFLLSTSSYGSPAGQDNKTSQLTHVNGLDHLDTRATTDMNSMFANDTQLQDADLNSLDTSQVTDMGYMFSQDWSLKDLHADDLDTSQVTNMHSIFASARSLQDFGIDKWNVANVRDLSFGFYDDSSLTSLDLNTWDTRNVTSLASIFSEDTNLQNLYINEWNTRQVQDMSCAFLHDDSSLSSLDLSGWQTPDLNDFRSAFTGDTSLSDLDLSNFDTSQVNDARYAFDDDEALTNLTLGPATRLNRLTYLPGVEWQHDGDIVHNEDLRDGNPHPGFWQQTQFSKEFHRAQVNSWHTGRWGNTPWYLDNQNGMHLGSGHLLSNLDNAIGDINAQNLRSIEMEEPVVAPEDSSFLFSTSNLGKTNESALTTVQGLDKLDMRSARDINFIFAKDYHLDNLDLSSWNTSNIHRMQSLFFDNESLSHLNVSDWNTQNVSEFQYAFYNTSSLTDLDLSGWTTKPADDMDHFFANEANLSSLALGNQTMLNSNASLRAGLWQADENHNQDEKDMMDDQAHPGTWRYVPTQEVAKDLFGTNYDNLYDLISRDYGLSDDNGNVQIMRDDHSQDTNGHLRPGDYHDIYYAIEQNGRTEAYHADLQAVVYVPGDDLTGNTDQSLTGLLQGRYGSSATIDDDGGSQNGNDALNYGDYQVRYHYQDASGNWNYRISNLHVLDNDQAVAPYLIVSDHPNQELYDSSDIQRRLVQFFGTNEDSRLDLSNVTNDKDDYRLTDGGHSYTGSIRIVSNFQNNMTMNDIPGASDDDFWNRTAMQSFRGVDGIMLDHSNLNDYQASAGDGSVRITGTLYPMSGQFINNPTIPYTLNVHPTSNDYFVDNTVNDGQVQDVVNSIGGHPQVISATDGRGIDVTGSFGELSTIPQNSNVIVRVKTDEGYRTVHFTHISKLIEPTVDVTHDSATGGNDISNADLRGQIQSQTHESTLDGCTVDSSQMVSSNVKAIAYHFEKTVRTTGNINVTTSDAQISGTAYVHYTNDDTSSTPTFTVVQGNDPVQHIVDVTGHPITILQGPDNIHTLSVGNYDVVYQYTDTGDATNFHANITVTPDYYFSPVTNDTNFNSPDQEAGYFKSYDYQNDGDSYKSVVDTQDHLKDDNSSKNSNNLSDSKDFTIDGLHTQDGKLAHFDSNNPDK